MDQDESEVINIREFLDSRLVLVRDDYFLRNKNVKENIKIDMQMPEVAINRLEEMCNPEFLNSAEHQDEIRTLDDLNSENLSILDFVKKNYTSQSKRVLPFEIKFVKNLARLNEIEPTEDDHIQTPDVIITVQISQSLNYKLRKLAWSEDFLVLGQTKLTELKDKICCYKDEIRIGEFSENPDSLKEAPVMKNLIRSGYFLIENVIYNDLRDENADLSDQVIKWSQTFNIGNIVKASMEHTKFVDLNVRLGFPYLYRHLGNCEHLIIFTSIKLVNPSSDCYLKSKYPIPKDKSRGRYSFCWCCNKLYAKWIVCGSKYAVDDPTFLCDRCLRNTHYADETTEQEKPVVESDEAKKTKPDTKYKKLFDFKAYHFSQL